MSVKDYIEVVHPDRTKNRHLKVELLCTDHRQCPNSITQIPEIIGKRCLQQPSTDVKPYDFPREELSWIRNDEHLIEDLISLCDFTLCDHLASLNGDLYNLLYYLIRQYMKIRS